MHKVAAQLAAAKELGLKAALLEETAAKAAKEAAILRKRQDAAHAMADEVLAGILPIGEPHSKADRRSAKSSGDRSGEGGEAGKTTSKRKATSDTTTSAKKVATPRVETYPVNLDERPKLEQFYLFPTDGFERSNYLEAVHRVPRRFASVLRGGAIVGLARIMELPTKRGVHVIVRRLDVPASSRAGVKHHIHLKDGWHEVSVKLSEWVLTATHAQLNTRKDHFELVSSVSEFEDREGNIKTMPFDSVLTSDEKEWKENKNYACSKLRI